MSWAPSNLAEVLAGVAAGRPLGAAPALMPRSDGPCLLYPGKIHELAAEPESGKGWIALGETARLLALGTRVLYIDLEDTAEVVVERLDALGVNHAQISAGLTHIKPSGEPSTAELGWLFTAPFQLVVVDGVSSAYGMLGLDEYAPDGVQRFFDQLLNPLADQGAAVLAVDHVVKDSKTRGRYAAGSQRKLGLTAVAYGITVLNRPDRRTPGRLALIVRKDRHGAVRAVSARDPQGDYIAAHIHVEPTEGGRRVSVTAHPPHDGGIA